MGKDEGDSLLSQDSENYNEDYMQVIQNQKNMPSDDQYFEENQEYQ
jgi:hypothetical protein